MPRKKLTYALLILGTIGLGLLSRTKLTPEFIYPYIGDAFYAQMMYFIMAFIFINLKPTQTFLLAIGLCFLIEISQLYHAPFIDSIRQTRLGGLVLGFGFLWSDLVAYAVGGLVGLVLETKVLLRKN
jgi:hypothetical protein